MKKIFIYVIAFVMICMNVTAQEKSRKEIKGDKYYFVYSFDKAIGVYSHTKKLSTEGQRRLAESYYNLDRNAKAEAAYSKFISSQANVLPEDYYNYAMVLKSNGKYYQASIWMDKFSQLKPDDLRAKDYVANKERIISLLIDDGKYNTTYLNINSNADDFGTSYYKNKVVFASTKQGAKMVLRNYNWNRKPFWDMYVSEVENEQLLAPKNFNKKLNGKWHDGPASFSNGGNYMAFTRNHYKDKSKDKVVELQIFFSTYRDETWSEPQPFIFNNEEYSVGQPFLTSDGNTMYFTSDMPGGFGGADIYKTTRYGQGAWGKPENLGNTINTEGDEMYPFLEESKNILFFSSNGRFGVGGLDIFYSSMNGSAFGHVFNAGYPLNTEFDDFAAIINGNKGYFTSNRSGGSAGDDLYSFNLLKELYMDNPNVKFSVYAPENIPVERRVREYFPIRNYVFFDLKSTEIPDRYVLLNKAQVKDFKEDQLEVFIPKNLSGRSNRQMIVYYNILNILGDRMGKNPTATITLVGSSEKGPEDAKAMAESVEKYLVDIFGIDAARINIEGRFLPKIPTEMPGSTTDLELKRQGDRRVTIESSSPLLLMEFQSGPEAPLKPVEIVSVLEAPLDSYVTYDVTGGTEAFTSWSLEIKDEKGKVQYFGPYTYDQVSIPGKSILGTRPEGNYKVKMLGVSKNGLTVIKDTTVHMALWTPSKDEEEIRFSIIYEFNDSKAINIYEKYLTDVVIPKIPKGAKVIIHGYTDITGEEAYNKTLSLARANDALNIIKNGMTKAGRHDVKYEVYGFGEDEKLSQFENKYPEQRFYNRSVVIDIIPQK
jgi:hypothetical protein